MFSVTISASSWEELKNQALELFKQETNAVAAPEVRVPVITQEQMEENVKNAPEHKLPDPPTIEEVRQALKELRARKGADAVRNVLKAYNVDSLTQLKEEDYAGAMDRALTEV